METERVLGIAYPFGKQGNASFDYTYDTFQNERSKLINLLRTKESERPLNPLFGLGLDKFLFEPITEELRMRIEDQIRKKIDVWLPLVLINSMTININPVYDRNTIEIVINFSVKSVPEYYDVINLKYN